MSMRKGATRTIFFAVVLALLPALYGWSNGQPEKQTAPSASAPAAQLTPVTFRLNWKYTGPHAAYFLGKQLGFYKQEGIDLQIQEGNGSITAAQLVANGSAMFGLADAAALMPLLVKGLPIKAVGMVSPRTSDAVIVRKDSGITTLTDLYGKIVATTAGDALTQLWPAVVARNHLDVSKIKLVYVDAAAKIPVVLDGKAQALLGSSADQNFTLEAHGVPAVTLDFADYGVNVLNLAIFASDSFIKQNPDLVKRFLIATQKSLDALAANTDQAIKLVDQAAPDLGITVVTNQTKAYETQLRSPNCQSSPMLYNCPEDWTQTLSIMKQYLGLQTDAKASDFYTNAYLPARN